MPTGLLIINGNNVLEIGPATKLARVIAVFQTTNANGSINIPALAQGQGFVVATPVNVAGGGIGPYVYISGTNVAWEYDAASIGTRLPVIVTVWIAI